MSLSNREISMLPRPQPNIFSCKLEIIVKKETRKVTEPLERNKSKISPLQWDCSTYKASGTSISKYLVQVLPGVTQGVHEIAPMWCPVWWLYILYSWWEMEEYSQWAQGTGTKAHIYFRMRLISPLTQLPTMTKCLPTSKRAEGDLLRCQMIRDHTVSVKAFTSPPLTQGAASLPWLIPTSCPERPCHSTQWLLHHWPTKMWGFGPSKMLEKGLSVETACITLQLHNWAPLAHPVRATNMSLSFPVLTGYFTALDREHSSGRYFGFFPPQ